jgi:phosphoadenosine phosphosulfate reductase
MKIMENSSSVGETALPLESLNAMFETHDAADVVKWTAAEFGDGVMMSSSFGADSAVMLHMVTQVIPDIKVVFVNTGYLFPQTHGHMEALRQRLNLNVWTYRTQNDPIAYLHAAGEENPAWRKDIDSCCGANKNEPFDRAMRELKPKAWLRGIRRAQAATRKGRQFIEWSARFNCYAVSPLLNWDRRTIHGYLKKYDLPYHPLFEQGYESIGCNPLSCTRPIAMGEDPRAGRWSESAKVECGINVEKNSLDSANI